jgi:hypothetical protein
MHGLVFEISAYAWQDQPDFLSYNSSSITFNQGNVHDMRIDSAFQIIFANDLQSTDRSQS